MSESRLCCFLTHVNRSWSKFRLENIHLTTWHYVLVESCRAYALPPTQKKLH